MVSRVLRARILSLPLVAIALLPAGCGDDEPEDSTVTETETVSTPSSTSEESTTTESTTSTSSTTEEEGASPADMNVTKLTGFTSPTGNIGCFIDRRSVRCDIRERDWEPPPAPADCELDYGQGITLRAGAAADFVCAGDTALDAGEPLPYGGSIQAGLLRCESEESGMVCRDEESGRGFVLAKGGYELF